MESFSWVFSDWVFGEKEPVYLFVEILVVTQLAGIFLLFKKRVSVKWFFVLGITGIITYDFLLPKSSVFLGFDFLPYRVQTFSLDTWAILLGWLIGLVLLIYSVKNSTRTLQRVIVSIVLIMTCSLMYGYHLLLIQGGMKSSMILEEQRLLRTIELPLLQWEIACETNGYECQSGGIDGIIDYHEPNINKQINDFVGFYRQESPGNIYFSMSKGLVVARAPFVAAFTEDQAGYRLMVDRNSAGIYFNIAEHGFRIFSNLAMFFWFFGGLLVIILHEIMIEKRNKSLKQDKGSHKSDLTI